MNIEELKVILDDHKKWLNNEGGRRANLRGANLRGADLRRANLRGADLRRADLRRANLQGADLWGADLWGADLWGADLWGANLRGADLQGADLRGANLRGAVGNMREIKSLQLEQYQITYTDDRLQIGCQNHPISEWWGFDDRRILEMNGRHALEWWRKWKDWLRQGIEMSPATPTGKEGCTDETNP